MIHDVHLEQVGLMLDNGVLRGTAFSRNYVHEEIKSGRGLSLTLILTRLPRLHASIYMFA